MEGWLGGGTKGGGRPIALKFWVQEDLGQVTQLPKFHIRVPKTGREIEGGGMAHIDAGEG